MSPGKATARWILNSQVNLDSSLQYEEGVSLPDLEEKEVLVEIHAASLNYRDLAIAQVRIAISHIDA